MIYLDNAATTLHKPEQVIQAVTAALQSLGNCSRGAHGSSLDAARVVYATRVKLAELFHLERADHVIFTSNSTEALNIALNGLFVKGDHVISTDLEHNSVLRPLYHLEDTGVIQLSFVAADDCGTIDLHQLEQQIRPETRAVVCTHASNLTGNLVSLETLGDICRRRGVLLVVDASQTAGAIPIDMEAMHIDVLAFTGHKGLFGPQGTGGLCIRPGVEIRPWKLGGSGIQSFLRTQPEPYPVRLEAGTLNGHGIAGLSAALDFVREVGVENIHQRETALACRFYEAVRTIPGIRLYGDYSAYEHQGMQRAPIVTLNLGDEDSAWVADELSTRFGIAVRAGGHCAPRMHQALGTTEQGAVRFSFSYFNTEEEVLAAAEAVRALAEE